LRDHRILFSPRFVIWRGLHIPEAWFNPEVNRAVNALEQLQDPLGPIDNPSNQVIRWRLFFPLLARCICHRCGTWRCRTWDVSWRLPIPLG